MSLCPPRQASQRWKSSQTRLGWSWRLNLRNAQRGPVMAGTLTVQPLPLSLSDKGPPARSLHIDLVVSILIFPNESLGVTIKICSFNNPSCLALLGVVLHSTHMTPWSLTTRLECSKNFTTETKLRTHKEQIKPLLGREPWVPTSKPHLPCGPPVPWGP